jgi:hypothetical protein
MPNRAIQRVLHTGAIATQFSGGRLNMRQRLEQGRLGSSVCELPFDVGTVNRPNSDFHPVGRGISSGHFLTRPGLSQGDFEQLLSAD